MKDVKEIRYRRTPEKVKSRKPGGAGQPREAALGEDYRSCEKVGKSIGIICQF
jgi:hypothetical protein